MRTFYIPGVDTPQALNDVMNAYRGTNLFRLDIARLQHDVGALPWVSRVEIEKKLPATLHVNVVERNGTPLLIKDIASVSIDKMPRQGIIAQDKDDEIVSGIVLMRKGENPSDVLAAIKEKVATLNRSVLPKGVEIAPYYDRTQLIETTLHTVFKNLLEGALLVTIVLFIFLGQLRAAGIVAVIPWIYNMLKKHPQCTFMIHRETRTEEDKQEIETCGFDDPFDMDERDPMKTGAIDSSIWEIETLQSHYHPNVATLAKVVSEQFTKQSYNMEDFLDHSYATLIDTELRKGMKRAPVVEFQIPKRIFTEFETNLNELGILMTKVMEAS